MAETPHIPHQRTRAPGFSLKNAASNIMPPVRIQAPVYFKQAPKVRIASPIARTKSNKTRKK